MINRALATVALLLSIGLAEASAEPQVLFDSGKAEPIAPYLEPLAPKKQASAPLPTRLPFDVRSFGLPVRTPSMTPGRVRARPIQALRGKMGAAQPLFLIGADRWSLQWLQTNRARLNELRAVGMIVSAAHAEDVRILRRAAGNLQLVVASGEEIARSLGLRHYPLLIAPPGMVAQ
jgi:integrating conjugative element protein (TIGR03765 family)